MCRLRVCVCILCTFFSSHRVHFTSFGWAHWQKQVNRCKSWLSPKMDNSASTLAEQATSCGGAVAGSIFGTIACIIVLTLAAWLIYTKYWKNKSGTNWKTIENKNWNPSKIISISIRICFLSLQFHFAEMAYLLHDITYELQWTAFVVLWFINIFSPITNNCFFLSQFHRLWYDNRFKWRNCFVYFSFVWQHAFTICYDICRTFRCARLFENLNRLTNVNLKWLLKCNCYSCYSPCVCRFFFFFFCFQLSNFANCARPTTHIGVNIIFLFFHPDIVMSA